MINNINLLKLNNRLTQIVFIENSFKIKCILILMTILLKTISCFSQKKRNRIYYHPNNANGYDLSFYGLKGIKSINEKYFEAIDSFGIVLKKAKIPKERTFYKFSKSGLLLEESSYRKNELFLKNITTYNKKGKKTEYKKYYGYKDSLRLSHVINYSYVENKLIDMEHYSVYSKGNKRLDATQKFRYDEKGKLIENIAFLPSGAIETKNKYQYIDEENLLMIITEYFGNGNIRKKIKEYKKPEKTIVEFYSEKKLATTNITLYNNNGLIVDKSSIDVATDIIKSNIFTYNDEGDEIREIKKSIDNGKVEREDYYNTTFKYDKQKNWIKSVISVNGVFNSIIEREINYY